MDGIKNSLGFGFRRLLAGGLVAGALGSALPAEDTSFGTGVNSGIGKEAAREESSNGKLTQLPPNVSPGWKIRICSEKTRAGNISFKISPADSARQQTATWTQGEPTLIALPTDLNAVDRIKVEATPGRKDEDASICILYDDHVAKSMSFDDRKVSTLRKTETGSCGC